MAIMVKENQQLDLFSELPTEEQGPSAEPDFASIAASGERRNATYDPNARTAENRRGSGGGFAAAVSGEIAFDPVTAGQLEQPNDPTAVPAAARTTPARTGYQSEDEAVPMPEYIRKQVEGIKSRTPEQLRIGGRSREHADQDFYAAHWRDQTRKNQ